MTSISRRAMAASCARGIEDHAYTRYPADERYCYCTRCGKPMRTASLDVPPPRYATGMLLRLRADGARRYEVAMPRGPLTVLAVHRVQGRYTYTLARPADPCGQNWHAQEDHLEPVRSTR